MTERHQSFSEEIANSITHGLFLLASVAATPYLIAKAIQTKNNLIIFTTCIFTTTVILVYFISTLYHAMPRSKKKEILRIVDYGSIYLLIAGSYTPFALNVIQGKLGWALFAIEWTMAFIGIVLLISTGLKNRGVSLVFYLTMGWLILIAIRPLLISLPLMGIILVFAGGTAYTFGVLYYRVSHLNFRHFIWHVFTVAGTTFHFIAVYLYAI